MGRGAPCRAQRQDPDLSPALALCEPIACHCPVLLLIVWVSRATPPARPGCFPAAPPSQDARTAGAPVGHRYRREVTPRPGAAAACSRLPNKIELHSGVILSTSEENVPKTEQKTKKNGIRGTEQESYICTCTNNFDPPGPTSPLLPSAHIRGVEHV